MISLLCGKNQNESINDLFCILLIQFRNQYYTSLMKTWVSFSLTLVF